MTWNFFRKVQTLSDCSTTVWIEMRPVADLIPYVRKPRTHPPEQVAQIAASMRRFGFTMPMLVAEDGTVNPGAVARQFGVSIAQIRKLFDAS